MDFQQTPGNGVNWSQTFERAGGSNPIKSVATFIGTRTNSCANLVTERRSRSQDQLCRNRE